MAESAGKAVTAGLGKPSIEPYYEDDSVTIYNADCLAVLPHLHDVPLIFTSPPYNLGVSTGGGIKGAMGNGRWARADLGDGYADHDDAMDPAAYVAWQQAVLNACWQTLTDDGAIFYNHKPRVQAGLLQTPFDLNPGLPVRQVIIWARAGGFNYAPTHYVPTHEWIVLFAKPSFRLASKEASGLGDVWQVPQESDNPHPAPFPLALPARALATVRPSLVLDPFMGSGTTLRAAKDAGVKAVGIEKSERYCEYAVRRLAQGVLDLGA